MNRISITLLLFFVYTQIVAVQGQSKALPLVFDAISFADQSPFLKVRKDGLEQYFHPYGLQLVDEIEESDGGLFEVVAGDAYGVLDLAGNVIADFKYEEISIETDYDGQWYAGLPYNYRFVVTKLDGKYGVIDAQGKEIVRPEYEEIKIIDSLIIAFRQQGSWGWLDSRNGDVIQTPVYQEVRKSYVLPSAVEIHQNGKEGLATRDGQVLIAAEYDYLRRFRLPGKQWVFFSQAGKGGLLDSAGNVILSSQFDNIDAIGHPEVVKFREQNAVGLWNMKEARVVLEGFTAIEGFVAGNSIVRKDQGYGVVQANGDMLLQPEYERIAFVDAQGIPMNTETGIIEMPAIGAPLAKSQHKKAPDAIEPYYMMVFKGGKQGVLDWEGKEVIPLEYRYVELLFKGGNPYFKVYGQERYGLFDGEGKALLPLDYTYDDNLSMDYYSQSSDYAQNQIIPLTKDGQIGLYHARSGKIILPVTHEYVVWNGFDQVSARRSLGKDTYRSETALYDREGNVIRPYQESVSYAMVAEDRVVETRMVDGKWSSRMVDAAGRGIYESKGWGDFNNTGMTQLLLPKDTVVDAGFRSGLLRIKSKEDNLFIDREGIEKRFTDYAFVGDFFDDKAVAMVYASPLTADETIGSARDKERFGIVDSRGEVVLPVVYERMEAIYNARELLKVKQKGKWGVVTKKGAIVMEPMYDGINFSSSSKEFVDIVKDGKQGIAKWDGTVVVPPVYERIHKNYNSYRDEGQLFMVFDGDWYQFVDEQGQLLNFRAKNRLGY